MLSLPGEKKDILWHKPFGQQEKIWGITYNIMKKLVSCKWNIRVFFFLDSWDLNELSIGFLLVLFDSLMQVHYVFSYGWIQWFTSVHVSSLHHMFLDQTVFMHHFLRIMWNASCLCFLSFINSLLLWWELLLQALMLWKRISRLLAFMLYGHSHLASNMLFCISKLAIQAIFIVKLLSVASGAGNKFKEFLSSIWKFLCLFTLSVCALFNLYTRYFLVYTYVNHNNKYSCLVNSEVRTNMRCDK